MKTLLIRYFTFLCVYQVFEIWCVFSTCSPSQFVVTVFQMLNSHTGCCVGLCSARSFIRKPVTLYPLLTLKAIKRHRYIKYYLHFTSKNDEAPKSYFACQQSS